MKSLKPSEVAKIAMNIEKNGEVFYTTLAEKVEEAEAKALFSHMAEEEKAHYDTFEKIFSRLASYEMPDLNDEDYQDYMRELVDSNVFAGDVNPAELAGQVKNPIEAIGLALGFEKDSIIFFSQLKKILLPEEQFAVKELIAEENKHIKRLLTVKKMLTSTPENYYTSQKTGDAEK